MRGSGMCLKDSRRPLPVERWPHQLGVEAVVHVALEHAVLDEHLALAGVALVVDVDGAAAVGHRAVVDDRHLVARHLLARACPANSDVLLRMKSASSPWPTASCSRMPLQPGASTTVCGPACASTAPSVAIACRAASLRHGLRGEGVEVVEGHPAAAAVEAGAPLACSSPRPPPARSAGTGPARPRRSGRCVLRHRRCACVLSDVAAVHLLHPRVEGARRLVRASHQRPPCAPPSMSASGVVTR